MCHTKGCLECITLEYYNVEVQLRPLRLMYPDEEDEEDPVTYFTNIISTIDHLFLVSTIICNWSSVICSMNHLYQQPACCMMLTQKNVEDMTNVKDAKNG